MKTRTTTIFESLTAGVQQVIQRLLAGMDTTAIANVSALLPLLSIGLVRHKNLRELSANSEDKLRGYSV